MQDKFMYGVLFYMCYFSGVFPLSWKSSKTSNSSSSVMGSFFMLRGRGIFCWLLQLAISIFYGLKSFNTPITVTSYSLPLHQLTIANRLIQICSVISTLLLVVPFHPLQTCASRAFHVYHLRKIPFPMSSSRFCLLVFSMTVSFFYTFRRIYQMNNHKLIFSFVHSYSYMITAAAEVVIMLMVFIAERAYTDINSEMKMLINHSSNITKLAHLEILINHHNITSEYVELLKDNFGVNFVNIFFWYILRMLSFGLYTATQIKLGVTVKFVAPTYNCCYVTLRLFLLCHHCHRLREEGEETGSVLRKLQLYTREELTEKQILMLETYQELVLARDLQFTACGLFNVSIQQVISVLSVLMTYILVAMQVK